MVTRDKGVIRASVNRISEKWEGILGKGCGGEQYITRKRIIIEVDPIKSRRHNEIIFWRLGKQGFVQKDSPDLASPEIIKSTTIPGDKRQESRIK